MSELARSNLSDGQGAATGRHSTRGARIPKTNADGGPETHGRARAALARHASAIARRECSPQVYDTVLYHCVLWDN